MAYKTLMLKIYDPDRKKRAVMDDALTRYAGALQFLLERCMPTVEEFVLSDRPARRSVLLTLVDADTQKKLNAFAVEPFKDSLKIEFASLAAVYIAQKRKNPKASYPSVFASGTAGDPALQHPLYFGRYAPNRDYCLMYDEPSGRFFAKMYLLNRKNKIEGSTVPGRLELRYLYGDKSPAEHPEGERRFLIVPLAFGKRQLRELNRALQNPGLIHTARLKKIKKSYYLLVNISCARAALRLTSSKMGLARDLAGGLHYTVCDRHSKVIAAGHIAPRGPECQKLNLLAKQAIALCVRYGSQAIVEANGGKNDALTVRSPQPGRMLNTTEYLKLVKILRYRLPEEGLPEPVEASANRLYSSCPSCGAACRKSRISARLFICVRCGWAADIQTVGSLNLSKRLEKYALDKVPISMTRHSGQKIFKNEILGFTFALPDESSDYSRMYYQLSLLVHSDYKYEDNPKKFAVIKKLREAPDIVGAVKIVDGRRGVSQALL